MPKILTCLRLLSLVTSLALLAACGNKGPLVPPAPNPAPSQPAR